VPYCFGVVDDYKAQIVPLRHDISTRLLGVVKKTSEHRDDIYAALDSVAKICNASKACFTKQREESRRIAAESQKNSELSEEVSRYKSTIADLQQKISSLEQVISSQHSDLDKMRDERDDFQRKTQRAEQKQHEYLQGMKALEYSMEKKNNDDDKAVSPDEQSLIATGTS